MTRHREPAKNPEFNAHANYLLWCWLKRRLREGNRKFIAEDAWRDVCADIECPPVPHPNALGALWLAATRKGWVQATGEYRRPKNGASRERACMVYRVALTIAAHVAHPSPANQQYTASIDAD